MHFQATVVGWSPGVAVSLAARAATPGVETFDINAAGFIGNTMSSTVVHLAAGGNPGGFIETRKDLTPPTFDIGALTSRPEFTGDYAAGGIQGVSVDLNFMTQGITGTWVRFRKDTVSNGWLHPLTVAFPLNVWGTYSVTFDPTWSDLDARANGWLTDQDVINPLATPSPLFADVLASVGFAETRIASGPVSTLVGIDNFRLSIPESSTVAAAGAAVLALGMLARRRSSPTA